MATKKIVRNLFQETESLFQNNNSEKILESQEMEVSEETEKLYVALFGEISAELNDALFNFENEYSDDTDSTIDFIKKIVGEIKKEFDPAVKNEEKNQFLTILTKIFATLLTVKDDKIERIVRLIKISILSVVKAWSD